MAADEARESFFRPVSRVLPEQIQVRHHLFKYIATRAEIRHRFMCHPEADCSRLYIPVPVAQFEAGMKKSGYILIGLLSLTAIQPRINGETNAVPHFQEVFRLLRANLPNVSEEELNQAAVQGLLDHFKPRVRLVTRGLAQSEGEAGQVSQTAIYDKFYGSVRV